MARFVDRKSVEIIEGLKLAPLFKKQGFVDARMGVVGEKIQTLLANGNFETSNIVKHSTDWVITNPDKETYILESKKFEIRYEPTQIPGQYQARGYSRIMKNPYDEAIEILASWGSPQYGDANCYFADVCDMNGENMEGEPYLLGAEEFITTYANGLVIR